MSSSALARRFPGRDRRVAPSRRLVAVLATVVSVVALVQGLTFERASQASRALASAASGTGGVFVPLQERVLDTRSAYQVGPYSTPMTAGTWRSVQISGVGGLPSSGIGAVQVAVSALSPVSVGTMQMSEYLTTPKPQTVLDYGYAGSANTNTAIVAVSSGGKIEVEATSFTSSYTSANREPSIGLRGSETARRSASCSHRSLAGFHMRV